MKLETQEFDILIVGSGPGGTTAAKIISENTENSVGILEEGSHNNNTIQMGSYEDLTKRYRYGGAEIIFGKPNINEFLKFKKIIDESKFSYKEIKNLYFFPSNRWDLKLKDDILLKLPNKFTYETLDYLYEFLENYNGESFNIVDARIENQIILNE
mgnify:CR=1 FL=1